MVLEIHVVFGDEEPSELLELEPAPINPELFKIKRVPTTVPPRSLG